MDWNSSALWGILGLIGGFFFSFIFYKIGTKNKKIIYTKNSQTLITNNLSEINGLDITYLNKPIKNLISTTVIIKSIGKDIINMTDFGKATPFCIKTTGEFLFQNNIGSTIIKNSNPNNLLKLVAKDHKTLLLDFDYLSQNDEITFVFLHTEPINVEGKLKTGSLINNNIFKRVNNILDIITYVCTGLLIIFISLGHIALSGLDGTIINMGNFLINLLMGIILINYFKKTFDKFANIELSITGSDNSNIFYNK